MTTHRTNYRSQTVDIQFNTAQILQQNSSVIEILPPQADLWNVSVEIELPQNRRITTNNTPRAKKRSEGEKLTEEAMKNGYFPEGGRRTRKPPPRFKPQEPEKKSRKKEEPKKNKKSSEQGAKPPRQRRATAVEPPKTPKAAPRPRRNTTVSASKKTAAEAQLIRNVPMNSNVVLKDFNPPAMKDFQLKMAMLTEILEPDPSVTAAEPFSEDSRRIFSQFPINTETHTTGQGVTFKKVSYNTGIIFIKPGGRRRSFSTSQSTINLFGLTGTTTIGISGQDMDDEEIELTAFDYLKMKPNISYSLENKDDEEAASFFLREYPN